MSRILIVEDETPMRTALQDVLEAEAWAREEALKGCGGE